MARPDAGHACADRVRDRDGLQRDVGLGGRRRRQPDVVPRAAGDIRRDRSRGDDRRVARGSTRGSARLAPSLVAFALLGCAAVLVVAQPINGARRWVSFGPATFQPSEVAKLAFTVWLAAHLAKRKPPRDAARIVASGRRAARRLPHPDPARARPRHGDHARGDGRRDAVRVGNARAHARERLRADGDPRPAS